MQVASHVTTPCSHVGEEIVKNHEKNDVEVAKILTD